MHFSVGLHKCVTRQGKNHLEEFVIIWNNL